jgi:hypothetical protein
MNLNLHLITDRNVRESFTRIVEFINSQPLLKGDWEFLTLTFTGPVTHYRVKHKLGFIPLDVIQTSFIGSGSLFWNYDNFDREFIDVTTTGPCVVRCFVGMYTER